MSLDAELDETWPSRGASERATLPPEQPAGRTEGIRQKAKHGSVTPGEELIVVALLEVSAAIDRLTHEVRGRN